MEEARQHSALGRATSMISIGCVFRGPELEGSPIDRTLVAVAKSLKRLGAGSSESDPWLNAVFVVPGSLGAPDFEGLEYGAYSRKRKGLVVQIAVPANLAQGDCRRFVIDSLHGANAMAFHFFEEKGDAFALREAEAMVASVSSEIDAHAGK